MTDNPQQTTAIRARTYPAWNTFLFLVLAATSLAACDPEDDFGVEPVDGFGTADAGADAGDDTGDGGVADGEGSATAGGDGDGQTEPLAFGVVSSDRTASSISLLGPDGVPLAIDFIHSASAPPGLVTALSGDLALPTQSGDPEVLTILDRFQTDVLTRVDPKSGEILGQLKTHTPIDSGDDLGYSSNPQDYVYIGPEEAWITRFEPNLADAPEDIDRGNDLLRINPTGFTRELSVSFDALNGEAEIENPDTGETRTVTVFARPGSIVRIGEDGRWLVVGLSMLSAAYDAAGKGMVALVDLDDPSNSVEGVALEGLQNCGSLSPVPGDRTRVVVSCSGFFRGEPRDSAGVALLAWRDGALEVEHVWRGTDDVDAPLSVASVVALGDAEVLAVAHGERAQMDADGNETAPATDDAAYLLDLASGKQSRLFEAKGRFVIGTGAINSARGLLLVPDASTDDEGRPSAGVRRFLRQADGDFDSDGVIELDEVLAAREVRAL